MGTIVHVMFGPVSDALSDQLLWGEPDGASAQIVRVLDEVGGLDGIDIGDESHIAQVTWAGGRIGALGRAGLMRSLQRARLGYEISEWPISPSRAEPIGRQVSWRPGLGRELVRLSDMTEGLTITDLIHRRLMKEPNPHALIGDYFMAQITPLEIGQDLSMSGTRRYMALIGALGEIAHQWR